VYTRPRAPSTTPFGGRYLGPVRAPWIMRAGEDGCTEERVEVGTWQMSASDASGPCVTPFEPISIEPCATTVEDAYVIGWCVDGT